MIALVIVYGIGDAVLALTAGVPVEEEDFNDTAPDEIYLSSPPTTLSMVRQIWGFSYSLFLLLVLCRTRQALRQRYAIPTAICGDSSEDFCCALCCGPCMVCQMARHTANYRRADYCCSCCCNNGTMVNQAWDDGQDKASCCSATGLVASPTLLAAQVV